MPLVAQDDAPPAYSGTSGEPLIDFGSTSDVPQDDGPAGNVPLVAQDEDDDADLVPAMMLDNRRYRWEPRRHENTTYWLLRTGRYYGKDHDTRETIYVGKDRDDPGGRAQRRGVDIAAMHQT